MAVYFSCQPQPELQFATYTEFERKMAEVLVVYKEVDMQQHGDELDSPEVTIY